MGMIKKKTRRGGRQSRSSKDLCQSNALSARMMDTLPRGVLPSLRTRLKQFSRGKAMRSNTCARKKRLNPKEVATYAGKGDTWLIHVP